MHALRAYTDGLTVSLERAETRLGMATLTLNTLEVFREKACMNTKKYLAPLSFRFEVNSMKETTTNLLLQEK